MSKYLQETFETINKNRQLYIQLFLVLGIILGISTFVGAISGLFIFIIFLILPLIVSVFAVSMKTALNKETSNSDIYFGYHRFGMSLVITTKMLVKPILMGFLTYFVVAGIGYSIMFILLKNSGHPIYSIIQSGDMNKISQELFDLLTTNTGFLITTIVSLVLGFVVTYNIYLKRSLTPLICFETTFTMDSAKKMSINMTNKEKKFLLFNNIFLALYVSLIVSAELIQMLLFVNDKMFYLFYFIEILFLMILLAPVLFINTLFITHYYIDNHRDKALKLYKEYLNVAMRTTQDNVINSEFNNNNNDVIDNNDKEK